MKGGRCRSCTDHTGGHTFRRGEICGKYVSQQFPLPSHRKGWEINNPISGQGICNCYQLVGINKLEGRVVFLYRL